MDKLSKIVKFKPYIIAIWFGLSLFPVVKSVVLGHNHIHNNYFVFKYNFFHVINQQNLYASYPENYFDYNHYGPIFSFIIAPFALMPDTVGVILWVVFTAAILLIAIMLLPVKQEQSLLIILLCTHEMMTSAANVQSNPIIAALIVLSFIFIKKERDFWAALMIALGIFIKLYGVVALAFFFFSNHKIKLVASLLFWSVVLFVLPMAISSPAFIVQTYKDWYADLLFKNADNLNSVRANISVMGMIHKIGRIPVSNIAVVLPGMLLFALSYIRYKYFKHLNYQLLIVASALIFPVIFSTGSESPTYMIAFTGVAIWYINAEKPVSKLDTGLMIFALILTSLSPSDLFPKALKVNYVDPYGLKALPVLLIWLKIIHETLVRRFVKLA